MEFTLFTADCTGNQANCLYPNKCLIRNSDDLLSAVQHDHVCAAYQKSYRAIDNFLFSDVLVMDIDNDDDTDDPWDYITAEKLEVMFRDISYALVPSRNHWKEKGSHPAAPRYHVFFPINKLTDPKVYAAMKQALAKKYPFFDGNALDAARFLYGSTPEHIIWHDGWVTIDEDLDMSAVPEEPEEVPALAPIHQTIEEGTRNNTMSRFAGRVLKRYGKTEKAYEAFLTQAKKCTPPLEDEELQTIWRSAIKFYENKVIADDGYVAPEKYNQEFPGSLKPTDYTDMGQALKLSEIYEDELCYHPATGYLRYTGVYWKEDEVAALGAVEDFVGLQLQDALSLVAAAKDEMKKAGIDETALKKKPDGLTEEQIVALQHYAEAATYLKFVMKRRDYKYIKSAIDTAKPMVYIEYDHLDKDEFLLNTPDGTYDLRKGTNGMREHKSSDFITKVTTVSPSDKGMKLWLETLNKIFLGDQELIEYVQTVVGTAAVGKVFVEALIIAYGEGRNGKSTFWNTIANVLGSYSGHLSADTLTVGCKRNVKPELAETKGKRMIIAAELEEGMRLNTSTVKQLCSTDEIFAEKKYKSPASFKPSHTVVLYTNHLPRVGANDAGTWRRLIVIPFNAVFEGNNDHKNFADYLYKEAGPAIMAWIIEGAKKAIDLNFHLQTPAVVRKAIDDYRTQSDWIGEFLEECCDIGKAYEAPSSEVYMEYRNYCTRVGEFIRSQAEFNTALENLGYEKHRTKTQRMIRGLKLKKDRFLE